MPPAELRSRSAAAIGPIGNSSAERGRTDVRLGGGHSTAAGARAHATGVPSGEIDHEIHSLTRATSPMGSGPMGCTSSKVTPAALNAAMRSLT